MSLCTLGLPDTAIKVRLSQKNTDVLGKYKDHGFALKTAGDNGYIKDVGTVCLDVETLISGGGGTFGTEKARLYLTLNHLEGTNTATIESGKMWHNEGDNPRGQYVNYKLVKGAVFTNVTPWRSKL